MQAKIGEDVSDEAVMPESDSMPKNRQVVSTYMYAVIRRKTDPHYVAQGGFSLKHLSNDWFFLLFTQIYNGYSSRGTCQQGLFVAFLLSNM